MIVFKFDWVRSTGFPLWLPLHLFLSLHTQVPAVWPTVPTSLVRRSGHSTFQTFTGTSPGLEFHHVLPQGGIHGSSTPDPCFVYFAVHVSWPDELCLILNLGSCPDADLVSFPRPTMAQFWRKVSYRWLLSALLSPFQVSEITGDWHYSEDGLGP